MNGPQTPDPPPSADTARPETDPTTASAAAADGPSGRSNSLGGEQSPSSAAPDGRPNRSDAAAQAVHSASRLSELLAGLGDSASRDPDDSTVSQAGVHARRTPSSQRFENHLAMVRLGVATSLFYALRSKHPPTAAHSLRVALIASAWCARMGLSNDQRDRIEVAALLHDIGKIGIPDRILRKPAKLTVEEQLTMHCCAGLGCEILRGCTSDNDLLDIVRWNMEWYDSRRRDDTIRGDALPLGARMLAIVGAFDSMTTDQVYRAAYSRERALQELFEFSGTQFDPELVRDFVAMLEERPELLHGSVVDRWLQQLDGSQTAFLNGIPSANSGQSGGTPLAPLIQDAPLMSDLARESAGTTTSAFHSHYQTLGRQLRDGVCFTDNESQVLMWNDTLSRMTGISREAIVGRQWDAETIGLIGRDDEIEGSSCPVAECQRRQTVVARSMQLRCSGELRDVFVQVSPVPDLSGGGCVIFIRDVSDRALMQNQIESLHKKATSDPLTGAANRAELDQSLKRATQQAKLNNKTFSLIICDIDHFKRVNDVHGHPAGDEALIEFAAVLQRHARPSDLVARYGGEEFVMLANGSDNATAARRAEEIRLAIASTPLQGIGGNSVTASFGVTEYQTGDNDSTVLARADRALLQAKENGRNRVVQLGSGIASNEKDEEPTSGWLGWLHPPKPQLDQSVTLRTPVPVDLAVEKLRGFIADHRAEIIHVTQQEVSLRLNVRAEGGRRVADQQFVLNMVVALSEDRGEPGDRPGRTSPISTIANVTTKTVRSRDRRNRELQPCVKALIGSLKSYLMAEIVGSTPPANP